MAVRALARTSARAPFKTAAVQPVVLLLALIAPALDLLAVVQPGVAAPSLSSLAAGVACAAVLLTWARYWRTSWLAAAGLAGLASLAMRFAGADIAPALSLLTVLALGIGGAFASGPSGVTGPFELG
jgi:hypothetical protein